ncbi:Uncharacterised protein [Mycobacteroides abscessus subsp. bolletii]|nr:Uncharacterised protein [Mycobacteroides abscessus subsp. bolletii]SHW20467.1 Uncharacterised protein [Mycobacteroides abscessus subsp. bolletii]SHW21306.1 Uncharacterised protein [Mycobacteroides abscessus subsp. bolletii]SHW70233.1 Uncharacterised protein [Mycobacteroides abscessus subsp. bolletii]SIB16825.1 Uncharacterised protein [Mycobacteroides abscessus subsp. bolletii]
MSAGGQTAGNSAAVKPKAAATRSGDAAASADGRNSGSDAKAVTKTRALTDPKPATSGTSGATAATDKPAASTVTGDAEAAGHGAKQQPSGVKSVGEPGTGAGAVQSEHNTASVAARGANGEVKADQTQLVDLKPLQLKATHDSASPSSVPSALTGGTGQAKRVDAQRSGRDASRSASHAGTDVGAKATDTSGSLSTSIVADAAGRAVTSTVRIGQSSPATSTVTDVKVPEHLTTVQVPTRQSSPATTETSVAPKTVAVAAVTAPTAPAPAPVAPVAPLPVPVVPANAPTAPGGATASITSALADVRKRGEGSGDTVTQEPANTGQVLRVQNAANTTASLGADHGSTLTSTEALAGIAAAAAQDPENTPRVRVARDTSSVAGAADDAAAQLAAVRDEFVGKATQLGADRAKLVADSTALREKHDALTAERQKLEADLEKHNKNLATVNADDAAIARDNAALTADILAHNAAVAAGGGSNAEAAALAVRQAALNARITANTQAKLKYNIEAAQLNSQQASINARADENLAEGIRLQQQAQEFGTRVTQFTEDLGKALKPIQRGGRSEVMAEALNAIKLSQQEAAQAANAASKAAFGETAGIATLPDGRLLILPTRADLTDVIAVLPDSTVTVLRGVNIPDFFPYLT